MPSTKRKKKTAAMADGWPVATSRLKKPSIGKPKQDDDEDLDFVASSSEESPCAKNDDLMELPALSTGQVLEACNGSDIQLARGASSLPNLAKGRGRYLVILPGMLSLKTQKKKTTPPDKNDNDDDKSAAKEETASETAGENDVKQAAVMSDKKTPANKRKPFTARVMAFGKMEAIETAHPLLKVPFGDGRTMVLKGKKMETCSKFMMMNCKANKGSVTCKDIFSSAIVFGEAKWEEGTRDDETAVNAETNDDEKADSVPPFRHYGGSDRTVDGVVTGSLKKQLLKKRAATKPKAVRKITSSRTESNLLDDEDDESDAEVNIGATPPPRAQPKRRAASQKKAEVPDSEGEEESEASDSDVDMEEAPPPRAQPKRRASSQKKVEVPDSESEEESEASDVGLEEAPPPPRASRPKRRASSQKKVEVLDSESEEESEASDSDVEMQEAPPPPRAAIPKRRASSQKKVEVPGSESEESETSGAEEEAPPPRAAKPKRRASSKKKVVEVLSDSDESEESGVEEEQAPLARAPPRKTGAQKRKAATQNKTPVAAKRVRKTKKQTSDDEIATDKVVVVDKENDEGNEKPNNEVLTTPPRRPRTSHARRSGSGSAKKRALEIDLTDDFKFEESDINYDDKSKEQNKRNSRSRRSTKKVKREIDLTEGGSEEDSASEEQEEEESDYEE